MNRNEIFILHQKMTCCGKDRVFQVFFSHAKAMAALKRHIDPTNIFDWFITKNEIDDASERKE